MIYISPEGHPDNNGTEESPLDQTVLEGVHSGETFILLPGVYRKIYARHLDTCTIKAASKWSAMILGEPDYHTVYVPGENITLVGLRTLGGKNGIHITFGTVSDCWVQQSLHSGVIVKNGHVEILRNLIEFCGSHTQFDHGIYASGSEIKINANIIRHNSSRNLHLYPGIQDSSITNNLIHSSDRGKGIIIYSKSGNLIAHNTIVETATPIPEAIVTQNFSDDVLVNNIIVGAVRHETVPDGDCEISHNCSEELHFVDERKSIFWLEGDSEAIAAGKPGVCSTDFFNEQRKSPPDIGAFEFNEIMTRPEYRKLWYWGWPYHYAGQPIPDLWSNGVASIINEE